MAPLALVLFAVAAVQHQVGDRGLYVIAVLGSAQLLRHVAVGFGLALSGGLLLLLLWPT